MRNLELIAISGLLLAGLPVPSNAQSGTTRMAVTGGYDVIGGGVENGFSSEALIGHQWESGLTLSGGAAVKLLRGIEAHPTEGNLTAPSPETEIDLLSVFGQLAYRFEEADSAMKRWHPYVGGRVGHVRYLESTTNKGGLEVGALGGVEYQLGNTMSLRSSAIVTHLLVGRGIDGVRARIQVGVGLSL